MFGHQLQRTIFILSLILGGLYTYAGTIDQLLRLSFDEQSSEATRLNGLKQILDYSKKAPAIIGNAELDILFENAPKISKDERILVLKILNTTGSLRVQEHYASYLSFGDNLIYKFYLVSSLKGYKARFDQDDDGQTKRYIENNKRLNNLLIEYLTHENPNMRFATVKAFASRKFKEANIALIEMFYTDQDEIKEEVLNTLTETSAAKALKECSTDKREVVALWCKRTARVIKGKKRYALALLKSQNLMQEFITVNRSKEEKETKKLIKKIKDELKTQGPYSKVIFEIGSHAFSNLPKNESFDDTSAIICTKSFKTYFSYPSSDRTRKEEDSSKEMFFSCETFIAKKKLSRAKHYLSLGQRMRNSGSTKVAIEILSSLIVDYQGLEVEIDAGIYLSKAYIINGQKNEATNMLSEVEQSFSEELTKKQKKLIKKLKKKLNKLK